MKREARNHSKMRRLCRRLDIPLYQAMGILECLWHLTASETPRGDIGKLSNEDIALALDYRGDEDALVNALVQSGWLESSVEHRLIVHDWHEHADDAVDVKVARAVLLYASGARPRMNRLSKEEKAKLCAQYEVSVRTDAHAMRTESHDVGTLCAPPEPLPLPLPEPLPKEQKQKPCPAEKRGTGGSPVSSLKALRKPPTIAPPSGGWLEPSGTAAAEEPKPPPSKRKRAAEGMKHSTDPRHISCKEEIFAYYRRTNGGAEPDWEGREGKELGMLLSGNPNLTAEGMRRLLIHRENSEVNHSERPVLWLGIITSYRNGPLDRFNKPLNIAKEENNGRPDQNKPGPTKQRIDATLAVIAKELEQRGIRDTFGTDGANDATVFEPSPRTVDAGVSGGFRAVGPEILPPKSAKGS